MKEVNGSRKVFVLGLDGATFDIIDPMIARGELPNIQKIIKEGVRADLNSTLLHNSPPAWTSFATGKNPGKHGIIGFTKLDPNSYRLSLVYGSHNRSKPMWEILGEQGKKVIVVNIPMTYPPRPVNGILISGLDAPSTEVDFTFPKEIKKEILQVDPRYKINLHLGGYLTSDARRVEALAIISETTQAMLNVVLHLMNHYPWDLFVVRFNSPDNVQHQFWGFMDETHPEHRPDSPQVLKDAIKTVYKELDQVVAKVHGNIDPATTNLIIMSDHGGGPRSGKSIYVNEWLRSIGYLSKIGEEATGIRQAIKRWGEDCRFFIKDKVLSLLLRSLSPKIKAKLMHHIPSAAGMTATFLRFSGINWKHTRAFAGEVEGVRINLVGKYPMGVVEPESYDAICDFLIAEARKLTDPETGTRIFKDVLKKTEAFQGVEAVNFPDLILKPEDKYYISPKFLRTKGKSGGFLAKDDHWRKISGSHRPKGIFIMKGFDCLAGKDLKEADIMDICPTVLYQLGVDIPDDLDGRVVKAAFKEEFLGSHSISFHQAGTYQGDQQGDVYSDQEASELRDVLRDLGYIDD